MIHDSNGRRVTSVRNWKNSSNIQHRFIHDTRRVGAHVNSLRDHRTYSGVQTWSSCIGYE